MGTAVVSCVSCLMNGAEKRREDPKTAKIPEKTSKKFLTKGMSCDTINEFKLSESPK